MTCSLIPMEFVVIRLSGSGSGSRIVHYMEYPPPSGCTPSTANHIKSLDNSTATAVIFLNKVALEKLRHLDTSVVGWQSLKAKAQSPGAPLTYFNDGGVRQRFLSYTQKNPNFRICLPKKIPPFFSIPKKIPHCFCISKFYYLSSEITESATHLCMGS